MRYHALIPAAGNGRRFRGDAPKQYWMLAGKPVLAHSLERLAAAFPFLETHVAIAPGDRWYDEIIGTRPGVTSLRCGGATRGETVRNALAALTDAGDKDWILVHDAVRPCVDPDALSRLREEVAHDAVGGLLALPVVGTLKHADAEGRSAATEPRSTNICSVSVIPTDSPALACSRDGAFQRSIVLTVLLLLPGQKISRSPTLMEPDSTRPARMRRSSKR